MNVCRTIKPRNGVRRQDMGSGKMAREEVGRAEMTIRMCEDPKLDRIRSERLRGTRVGEISKKLQEMWLKRYG